MATTYISLRDDYNARTIRLCSDLFKLTQRENFKRLAELMQNDIEAHQPALILWKHIDQMKSEHIQHVLEGNRAFFENDSFEDERAGSMVREFQTVWHKLSAQNQNAVFTKLQNIFRIAERIRTEFYDDIVNEAVM
jgi:hypothetical protein